MAITGSVDALYNPTDHSCENESHNIVSEYSDPVNLEKIMQSAIERVHERKLKAGDHDVDLWRANVDKIWQGVNKGWKNSPRRFSPEQVKVLELRRNINVYGAFKNHNNVIELVQALTDSKGNIRSFNEFKRAAGKINDKYNKNWLKSEYDYATKAASWAEQWQELERRGGKLEYRSQRDGNVREEHRKLDGIVLPVTDKFWDTYYPPNGWGCRCFVRRRPDSYSDVPPTAVPDDMKPMFKNNVGKTGRIFTQEHPVIKDVPSTLQFEITELAEKETMRWERSFIKDAIKELIGKAITYKSEQFASKILFKNSGFKDAMSKGHPNPIVKNRLLLSIEDVIKNSTYLHEAADSKNNPFVRKYHYLKHAKDGVDYFIVLRENVDGEVYFYSIVDRLKK